MNAISATTCGGRLWRRRKCRSASIAQSRQEQDDRGFCRQRPRLPVLIYASGFACPRQLHLADINPNLGVNQMLFPSGRSTLQRLPNLSARQRPQSVFRRKGLELDCFLRACPGLSVRHRTLDFVNTAIDNNHPNAAFLGPNGLDRTHQFSFGGTMDIPLGSSGSAQSVMFIVPLPQNMLLPGGGAGRHFHQTT